ncbi:hypothetical protein IVB25_33140 [Bradyrhizobium sp. 193]|uniref:hypothetical protein n=1 Tax=Bradyrhizobium sp. 193 TaxID=2782661 RepID=UPI001FF96154|nr:hypothetical protein [Bradyrhizobium sp. 193]MCK1487411.1 hypothetical protein [Bradyrhizobium sp. 193]
MAKATAQARLAAGRCKAACREDQRHQRAAKQPCFCGILDQIGMGPMREKMLSRSVGHRSNWRMDQCAIHMDGARTMPHRLWQTFCPILPQLNVIQCTDRRMAAT